MPFALEYGMSSKEFWEDNPDLFWAYRFSYITRKKREREEMNFQAWLQGAYINEAVSVALNNGFNKQKIRYSSEPYPIFETKEEKKKKEIQEKNNAVIELKGRVKQVQSLWKQNHKEKDSIEENGEAKGGETINER